MPVRAVCKPHSLDLKKKHSSGCNLWRSLLERPPPVPESQVRDSLEARTSCGCVDPGGVVTYTVGTESIQTPLHFSLFVILQPFAKII